MHTNHLIGETSPYLLQHAHNPVDWYPWSEESLEKAVREDKLLIISIGYAACHWCHVMEEECFEDDRVAAVMNEHFISIKVDREERPDIDQVYMDAIQLISGRGGWPLNAIALPDGRPVYAGTYFPKDQWISVLNYLKDVYSGHPDELREQADKLTRGIRSLENDPPGIKEASFTRVELEHLFRNLVPYFDTEEGGLRGAPKFPMPVVWEFVLHYGWLSGDPDALRAVTLTLDNMALGGMFDHLGGGFARYATDAQWHIPHFEKMLYDNAQLVSLYSHAWQHTRSNLYRDVVYETLNFIKREMTSGGGGFYSSLDADSEGGEGSYYVWKAEEIEAVLGSEAKAFSRAHHVTEEGNWEHGKNILYLATDRDSPSFGKARKELLEVREKRARPRLDDKIIASWNALMINGFVDAYRAFNEEGFLQAALAGASFLRENLIADDHNIIRTCRDGKKGRSGFLDDYAFVISAFIGLYQATFDEQWIHEALSICNHVMDHYYDEESGLFFYTPTDREPVLVRKREVRDTVIPSSNSRMAMNLFTLGHYFYLDDFVGKSGRMLSVMQEDIRSQPYNLANWAILRSLFTVPPDEVAILGKEHNKLRIEMERNYLPGVFFMGGPSEGTLKLLKNKLVSGQTTIYVCRDKTCSQPVVSTKEAISLINRQADWHRIS